MSKVNVIQKINALGMPINLVISTPDAINNISVLKAEELKILEKAFRLEAAEYDSSKELYMYFYSQPSSGYQTEIEVLENGEFQVNVTRPKPNEMTMSAFFTDIIVFQK